MMVHSLLQMAFIMMTLSLLALQPTLVACSSNNMNITNEDVTSPITKIAAPLASPEVAAALGVLQKVEDLFGKSRTSGSFIGERVRGVGFEQVDIDASFEYTVYRSVEPVVEVVRDFVSALNVDSNIKRKCETLLRGLVANQVNSATRFHTKFIFTSPKLGGSLDMAFIDINERADGRWEVNAMQVVGTYKVMPDWFVRTNHLSKKRFLSSSSSTTQEIVYVDRGVTKEDVQDLFFAVMPALPNLDGLKRTMMLQNGQGSEL